MEKILVSACLFGVKCRYDGGDNPLPLLDSLKEHYEIVAYCPEVEGGLPIPREKSEIRGDKVVSESEKDVTAQYELGAEKALALCRYFGIKTAILKEGSPACGPRKIHDGNFNGNKIDGMGVTAKLLVDNGIRVYSDEDAIGFLLPEERKGKMLKEGAYVSSAAPRKKAFGPKGKAHGRSLGKSRGK